MKFAVFPYNRDFRTVVNPDDPFRSFGMADRKFHIAERNDRSFILTVDDTEKFRSIRSFQQSDFRRFRQILFLNHER